MKKPLIFVISIVGGLLLTVFLVSTLSAMAEAPQKSTQLNIPLAPVRAIEFQAKQTPALTLNTAEYSYAAADPSSLGINSTDAFTVKNQWNIDLDGSLNPGGTVTFTYVITPYGSDNEDIDAKVFWAPEGWDILAISDAPAATQTDCSPSSVTQSIGDVGGREVAYWGGNSQLPNWSVFTGTLTESNCGVWEVTGDTPYTFWVKMEIPGSAVTCPGMERVGIPFDPKLHSIGDPAFFAPIYDESSPAWLYGDGNATTTKEDIKLIVYIDCDLPDIRLEKTVGEVGDCPNTTKTSIEIPQGDKVEYCLKWYNDGSGVNSTWVSVKYHDVMDTILGTGTYTEVLPPNTMSYLAIPYTITGTVGTVITNTAIWTATTEVGFGQSVPSDPKSQFTTIQYSDSDEDTAYVTVGLPRPQEDFLYLPLMFNQFPPPIKPGLWAAASAPVTFYVSPNSAKVTNFSLTVLAGDCGERTVTYPDELSIKNDEFSFTGSFYASGTFDSYQSASGKVGMEKHTIPGCPGLWSTDGDWDWSVNWVNDSQPTIQMQLQPVTPLMVYKVSR